MAELPPAGTVVTTEFESPVCLKCGTEIDEVGCNYGCPMDYPVPERPRDTFVIRKWRLVKTLIGEREPA